MSISTKIYLAVKKANREVPSPYTRQLNDRVTPHDRLTQLYAAGYRILEVNEYDGRRWHRLDLRITNYGIITSAIKHDHIAITYLDNTVDKLNHLKNNVYETIDRYGDDWTLTSRRNSRDTKAHKQGIPCMSNLAVYRHVYDMYRDIDDRIVGWLLREVNAFIQELLREQNRMINGGSIGHQLDTMFSLVAPGLDWAIENQVHLEPVPQN